MGWCCNDDRNPQQLNSEARIKDNKHFASLLRRRLESRHRNGALRETLARMSDAELIESYLAGTERQGREHDARLRAEKGHIRMNSPSAGDCGEPNFTTLSGIPICPECGKSTRNRNALVCAPCRNRTRLPLTTDDKKWLQKIGISRER